MNKNLPVIAALSLFAFVPVGGLRAAVSTESPFMPRGMQGQMATPQMVENSPIEFRGVMADANGARFALYDPVKKDGAWVRLDEKGAPYVVRSYDAANGRITVDYQGRSQTIALKEAKFGGAPAVAAMPTPQPMPSITNGGAIAVPVTRTPPVTQGGSADDARRLEAIRAEVARRRAAREAAAQGANGQQ